jgi:hypothetical protein
MPSRPSGYERNFLIIAPLHRKNMSLRKELCALRSGYNYRQARFPRASRHAG